MMIHRSGTKCECILPDGYDDRTMICLAPNEKILVVHPDFQPCFYERGELVKIKFDQR